MHGCLQASAAFGNHRCFVGGKGGDAAMRRINKNVPDSSVVLVSPTLNPHIWCTVEYNGRRDFGRSGSRACKHFLGEMAKKHKKTKLSAVRLAKSMVLFRCRIQKILSCMNYFWFGSSSRLFTLFDLSKANLPLRSSPLLYNKVRVRNFVHVLIEIERPPRPSLLPFLLLLPLQLCSLCSRF